MASQKEPERIISGGLDLVSPQDKMDGSSAVLLENWRIDQVNQLRSRRGRKLALTMGSGNFHTIKLNPNGETVFGVGTGAFVGLGQAVTGATFDGYKLGVATYLGFTYIMNRTAQVRLNGVNAYPWTPLPPTAAPVAVAVAPAYVTIEEFDGTGAVTVSTMTDSVKQVASAPVYDNVNFQSGAASLSLVIAQACTTTVAVTGSFNTATAGFAAYADQFSFWFYASDPTQIRSITVTLQNAPVAPATQGATVQAYLQPGSAWDVGKILNQKPGAWTQVFIRRALDVDAMQAAIGKATAAQTKSDLTAQLTQLLQNPCFQVIAQQNPQILGINNTPISAQNTGKFDWTAITQMTISVVTQGAVQVNVDVAAFSSVNAAAALSGSGQYYVSFVDEAAHDSLPSPVSNLLTLVNQAAQLTGIPTSAAANVVARNVYRIGFGVSSALLVGVIHDNFTATWTDPKTTSDAEFDGNYMPIDRVPPPAARGCIGPFFGKLIVFNTKLHPSRYYWSNAGVPWAFPGGDDSPNGNWEDAGGNDDEILGATDHKTLLVLYKRRSIWRLPGDPATSDAVRTNGNVGAVGASAFCSDGAVDFFVSAEGVYLFNLDEELKISKAIDPIFKGDYVRLASGDLIPPIDPTNIGTCAIEIANERLRVSYPELGNSTPNVVLIYNKNTGQWAQERYGVGFSALAYWGTGLPLTAGAPGGGWYNLETGATDDGSAIALRWQSKQYDQGLPDNFKWYSDIEVESWLAAVPGDSAAPVTLTVSAVFDNGLAIVTLGTAVVNLTTKQVFSFRLAENPAFPVPAGGTDYGYRAKNVAIRVTANATSELIIGGVYVHWYAEERVAHTFDSGPTDFGIPEKVKQVDYLEFYATGTGQALQRTVASDLPGRLLTIRDQANMTAPNGRGDVRFRLASVIEGRNFRVTVNDAANGHSFQMHKARARMRPVGEYVDGTNGEYFESPEFSVAPGRVGELKDFLVDYDVSAAGGSVVLYSDLPGSSLAVMRTLSIPFQTGRAPYVFPFESGADTTSDFLPAGQLFKVRLYPPAGGILRLHGRAQFRGRLIGTYFNGTNGEVFQTQPVELFGGEALAREILCTLETGGPMTLTIGTEIPNADIPASPTLAITLNPFSTTPGRTSIPVRLPGNTKGTLWRFTLSGGYITRLFELKVLGRRLTPPGSDWDWAQVPLEATPNEWQNIAMPCGATPEEFTWIDIPVDPVMSLAESIGKKILGG